MQVNVPNVALNTRQPGITLHQYGHMLVLQTDLNVFVRNYLQSRCSTLYIELHTPASLATLVPLHCLPTPLIFPSYRGVVGGGGLFNLKKRLVQFYLYPVFNLHVLVRWACQSVCNWLARRHSTVESVRLSYT